MDSNENSRLSRVAKRREEESRNNQIGRAHV